ncbi:RING finger protein 24 isoform X3 [Trichomycterus rosablanca]|uniref:RING finger protein 24 isoform X3 n=1 Tax=Trichomycterus rosablanca TaxID=2290929 RepID=UPI002F3532EC
MYRTSMTSDFHRDTFRMPNIGFQNLPLNIYIVVFGTAIFVFILSLLFCCYLIRVGFPKLSCIAYGELLCALCDSPKLTQVPGQVQEVAYHSHSGRRPRPCSWCGCPSRSVVCSTLDRCCI